jgi:hypothetical protein
MLIHCARLRQVGCCCEHTVLLDDAAQLKESWTVHTLLACSCEGDGGFDTSAEVQCGYTVLTGLVRQAIEVVQALVM